MNFKRFLAVLLGILLVLIILVMVKTVTYPFEKIDTRTFSEVAMKETISDKTIQRFIGGIQIPTVSNVVYEETDFTPFDEFKAYLPQAYPAIYETMDTMTINTYGLVFRWKGKRSDLNPILFLSHYDVVPVNGYEPDQYRIYDSIYRPSDAPIPAINEFQTTWDYPPFSGAFVNGRIYGRGTLDMKGMLFSLLEAADALISKSFQPERDIWFAFGHDEEVSGLQGAYRIAEYFKEQGLIFDAVYDEGSFVLADGLEGINRPLALVGLGEKGFLTMRIRVYGIGGHSSMPPAKGSLVMAAEIIEKLNTHQLPARIISPVSSFLDNIGGEMGFTARMAIANKWLLQPVLLKTLSKSPGSNALIRTTTAVTMAKSSEAANVLSSVSEITVNFRILQGETVGDIVNHVKELCEGYEVEYEIVSSREPSGISPEDTRGFNIMKTTILNYYPDAICSSYITIGGTDAYKYQIVSDNIYRFMPLCLNTYEQRTIHNENEHISVQNLANMIGYFKNVMSNFDSN